jgi:hypothetical protein
MKRTDSGACELAQERATAWIDGEGPLDPHVEGCARCRDHVAGLRELRARFAKAREARGGADLWPAIAARVAAAPRSGETRRRNAPVPALARIAAGLIGFAATLLALRELVGRAEIRRDARTGQGADWAAALHAGFGEHAPLASTPENRLLAALEAREERR